MSELHLFLTGASTMGYGVAAIFFGRFWEQERDRLFLWFAGAFVALALNRVLLLVVTDEETGVEVYLLRLAAFLMIGYGVVEKNRR